MYENATILYIKPGDNTRALCVLSAEIAPMLLVQPGLAGLCLLPDEPHNRIVVLTLWSCRSAARAVEAVPTYVRGLRALDALLAEPPMMTPADLKMRRRSPAPASLN